MKVYVGGTSEEVCGACVAHNIKEAKTLLWGDSDVCVLAIQEPGKMALDLEENQ